MLPKMMLRPTVFLSVLHNWATSINRHAQGKCQTHPTHSSIIIKVNFLVLTLSKEIQKENYLTIVELDSRANKIYSYNGIHTFL